MHFNNCFQFPVRLCFAVTSNKAQGQTMKHVGIYLQQDFFSHGQLYVALSRVQSPQNLKIYRPYEGDKKSHETTNVVFKEVLTCHCVKCKGMKEKVSIDEVFLQFRKSKYFPKGSCRLNIRNLYQVVLSSVNSKPSKAIFGNLFF